MINPVSNLKLARRGAIISIFIYLFLSAASPSGTLAPFIQFGGRWFNNVSDIVDVALLIGIRLAHGRRMRSSFGHWKIEDL